MTLKEHIRLGYILFGKSVMKEFNSFVLGKIDCNTFLNNAWEVYKNDRSKINQCN